MRGRDKAREGGSWWKEGGEGRIKILKEVYGSCSPQELPMRCLCSTDGSVVEFSPATREARVRFPVSAFFSGFFLHPTVCRLIHYLYTATSRQQEQMVQW